VWRTRPAQGAKGLDALGVRWQDLQEPLPDLGPMARQAAHCWTWCDGWHPERWPVYGALHDVADWAGLSDLMQTMRDEFAKLREAEAK